MAKPCDFGAAGHHVVDFGTSSLMMTLISGVVIRETEGSQVVNLLLFLPPLEMH